MIRLIMGIISGALAAISMMLFMICALEDNMTKDNLVVATLASVYFSFTTAALILEDK